jgi:hypothetical protein
MSEAGVTSFSLVEAGAAYLQYLLIFLHYVGQRIVVAAGPEPYPVWKFRNFSEFYKNFQLEFGIL